MSFWTLVTVLASLGNVAAIVFWQHANERRLDIHWARLTQLQKQQKELLPMLKYVSAQLQAWESWKLREQQAGRIPPDVPVAPAPMDD